MTDNKPYFTAYDLLKKGGKWLGAARSRIKTMKCFGNGEHVTWGSNDVIEPHMTIGQVEEIAAEAAAATFTERADMEWQIEKLREALLRKEIELSHRAEFAEAEVRRLAEVLSHIATCESNRPDDIVSLARETLEKVPTTLKRAG